MTTCRFEAFEDRPLTMRFSPAQHAAALVSAYGKHGMFLPDLTLARAMAYRRALLKTTALVDLPFPAET